MTAFLVALLLAQLRAPGKPVMGSGLEVLPSLLVDQAFTAQADHDGICVRVFRWDMDGVIVQNQTPSVVLGTITAKFNGFTTPGIHELGVQAISTGAAGCGPSSPRVAIRVQVR